MVFWGAAAAAAVAIKRDQLRAAEAKLLQLMSREEPAPAVLKIETTDTYIPADAVPLSSTTPSAGWCGRNDEDEKPQEFVIHGIQVTNANAEEKTNTDGTTHTKNSKPPPPPPLVLLHGYCNGGAYFYRNLMGLSRYFSQIHALDLLGWGLSSRPNLVDHARLTEDGKEVDSVTATEDFFVESLEAWRAENQVETMILAGHSMGGYLSVAYSERYPQRVERLILISPVGIPEETADDHQRRTKKYLSSLRARLFYGLYTGLFERHYTAGGLLRTVSESRGRGWIANYVTRRLPAISDPDEQQALTDYLYHNNTLPGSGEYCLAKLLKPSVFGRRPLEHRIPQLLQRQDGTTGLKSCTFLYGESDWMDASGGLRVQTAAAQQQPPQSSAAASAVNVYQVSQAGHLLMLDNAREFNHGVVMAAGLGDQLPADAVRPTELALLPEHGNDEYDDDTQQQQQPTMTTTGSAQ